PSNYTRQCNPDRVGCDTGRPASSSSAKLLLAFVRRNFAYGGCLMRVADRYLRADVRNGVQEMFHVRDRRPAAEALDDVKIGLPDDFSAIDAAVGLSNESLCLFAEGFLTHRL